MKYDAEKLKEDTESALNSFRLSMQKIADECISKVYCDVLPHIETDAWTNYREQIRIELAHEYKYSSFKNPWAKDLRRAILVENRDELVNLLNADLLERIKVLEDRVNEYEQFRYSL